MMMRAGLHVCMQWVMHSLLYGNMDGKPRLHAEGVTGFQVGGIRELY